MSRIIVSFLSFLSIAAISLSCYAPAKKIQFTGEAQGTYYAITYFDVEARNLQHEIDSILDVFDQTASMWQPNSIISKINRDDPDVVVDEWFTELFVLSKEIGEKSDGAFDMTIGPLVNAWGFGFTDRVKLDQQKVDSLLNFVDYTKVELVEDRIIKHNPNVHFDFNGIAQGYSVDVLASFLESKGIRNYLIDVGGEVYGKGSKPNKQAWTVGIENPSDNAQYGQSLNAIVELKNKALATSGSYRKFYEENGVRYSHTIDPETGYPVTHNLLSVSVLADDCATADGYATAFMVMGRENAMKFLEHNTMLEAYFIEAGKNGNFVVTFTDGFEEILE